MYDFLVPVLNFLRRQVGLRGDSASSTGSVHAKLADLVNVMKNAVFGAVSIATATSSGVWGATEQSFTGPSYSGEGRIHYIRIRITGNGGAEPIYVRGTLVVDGTSYPYFGTVYNASAFSTDSRGIAYWGKEGYVDSNVRVELNIPFRSGFSVGSVYYKSSGWSGGSGDHCECTVEYEKYN